VRPAIAAEYLVWLGLLLAVCFLPAFRRLEASAGSVVPTGDGVPAIAVPVTGKVSTEYAAWPPVGDQPAAAV
jgi:hypothetical protein